MSWRDLFEQWWNAIYSIPLLVALIYLGISLLLGGLAEHFGAHHGDVEGDVAGDVGADHDVGHDIGHDVGHDIGDDVGHDIGHDIAHDGGHDVGHEPGGDPAEQHAGPHHSGGTLLFQAMAFMGVGRAPLMLVVQFLLMLWGGTGLIIHSVAGGGSPLLVALSAPVSLAGGLFGTRLLAVGFDRVFGGSENHALAREELTGTVGRVVFPVTSEEGTIHFRDRYGTLHRARARSRHESLEPGREVVLLGYDPEQNVYWVDDAERFVHRRD